MWWTNLFKDMSSTSFFNFSFLPAYTGYFLQGMAYTVSISSAVEGLETLPLLEPIMSENKELTLMITIVDSLWRDR